ncbi:MAG TPA: hypothetical protein VMB22_01515 [Verrucomicrobiae bacterium]|nr:hypothetical protein [Verrucomicrobiae bacterium]
MKLTEETRGQPRIVEISLPCLLKGQIPVGVAGIVRRRAGSAVYLAVSGFKQISFRFFEKINALNNALRHTGTSFVPGQPGIQALQIRMARFLTWLWRQLAFQP